jgi:iron complex outermembrane receptor protein
MLTSPLSKLNIINRTIFLITFLLFLFYSIPVFAQEDLPVPSSTDDALDEELRYLQAETYVITPSRIPENIKKTASSISVITDKQIRQMGAKHLADVIQTVPGMGFWYGPSGAFDIGVRGGLQPNRILLMLNSHSLHKNYTGEATWVYDTMNLDNVKRIEVIRGPGSALYGANAFIGVINVITKDAEDVDGWEVTARGGSYDTQQYNLLYGKTFNDLEIAFNYNYFNTHGYNGHVNADRQTTRDRLFGTNASLAPGRLKGDDEKYDVALNLKYKGFEFDGRYVDRERDWPIGFDVLSNKYITDPKDYYLNLSYQRTLWEDLEVIGKVYRNHFLGRAYRQTFPPGAAVPTPWGPFVMRDGVNSISSFKNNRTGFEIQATYKMSNSNTVVAGISYEEMKQYDVNRRANYLTDPLIGFFYIPLPSIRDLSDIQNFNRSAKRNFKAFFIEDIWDITEDLRLTVGVRYDDYSDFGSEVSPRAGLVWEFIKGYDLKLLYGHAFRAPTFDELYDSNLGNPDLDPETIDTYEVSLGAEFTSSFSSRVTFFHSEGKDNVVDSWFQYVNLVKTRFQGIEAEAKYDFGRGTYLAMNYTYQRWISPHTNLRNWFAPRHIGNVMAHIRLSKHLNFYTACHIEDTFRRMKPDTRDNMSGYAIVNATLIAKKFLEGYEGLEVRGSVYNLFDKDYTSPTGGWLDLPDDMPRPGRNFLVEVKYKF